MTAGTPARLIASCFGLAAFAVAIVAGVSAGNDSTRVLTVAMSSLIVCHVVGLVAGLIGERVVDEYMKQYRSTRPVIGPETSPSAPEVRAE